MFSKKAQKIFFNLKFSKSKHLTYSRAYTNYELWKILQKLLSKMKNSAGPRHKKLRANQSEFEIVRKNSTDKLFLRS